MMSSLENSVKGTDVFSRETRTPVSIPLSKEAVNRLIANAPSATAHLSQEATDKSLKDVIQLRNSTIEKSSRPTNGITNDIDTYFSALQSSTTISKADMSGLISDALQSYSGSGNTTTLSMDLAVTQGMLNKLVERFVPQEKQAESYREVSKFVSDKVTAQDTILQNITQQSLDIARQYGDKAGVNQFQQQLDQISRGQHETQKERDTLFSITESNGNSTEWLSGFRQMVSQSGDSDFFKRISYDHISQLESRIAQFVNKAKHVDADFSLAK